MVNSLTSGSVSTSGQTSSRSSNTRRRQQVEENEEYYWDNILEYMGNNWLEEKGITTADELREGVLRKKLEDNQGKLEDTEEFITALRNKEDMK
eukprot:4569755-Amphidinium_carterae.2